MLSQKLSGWIGRTTKSLFEGRAARRKGNRPSERRLVLEALEGRELLAVATISRDWKDFEFAGPATLTGNLSGKYGTQPVSGKFTGNLAITGNLDYAGVGDGAGEGLAKGPVNGMVYGYGNLPTMNVDGETAKGGIRETAGKFSATLPSDGALGAVTLNGTLNTKNFTVSGGVNFTLLDTIKGSGTWSGSFAPVNPQPLTVATTAQWDPEKFGTVDVDVLLGGSVQKAKTRTTAIATVNVYWGNAAGAPLTKLADTIPLLWNQATGHYEVSALPNPPTQAMKLLFVTTFAGTSNTVAIDLPVRPTLSISSVSVTSPAVGTVNAVFTVTLSGNTISPITVRFATANGTAVSKQDFTAKSGRLTFVPNGPLTQTIVIKVKRDATIANQDFYVKLTAPTWATINGSGIGTGSIIDV